MRFLAFCNVSSFHLKFETVQLTDQLSGAQFIIISLSILIPAPGPP